MKRQNHSNKETAMIMNLNGGEGVKDCDQLTIKPDTVPPYTLFQSAVIREIINIANLELSNDEFQELLQSPPEELFVLAQESAERRQNNSARLERLNDPQVQSEAEALARASPFYTPTDALPKPH
jgi:hypothetical protein